MLSKWRPNSGCRDVDLSVLGGLKGALKEQLPLHVLTSFQQYRIWNSWVNPWWIVIQQSRMTKNIETRGLERGDIQWRMLSNWMPHNGIHQSCVDLHPGTSCPHEVLARFLNVAKSNYPMYLALHLIPFFLFKVRSLRRKSKLEILGALVKLIKRCAGSLVFMSSMVAIFKAFCCLKGNLENTSLKFLGHSLAPFIFVASVVASPVIFFQQQTRRKEITLYALVRALYSMYLILKRRGYTVIPHVSSLVFVVTFGLLSVCYHRWGEDLTYKGALQKVWGAQ